MFRAIRLPAIATAVALAIGFLVYRPDAGLTQTTLLGPFPTGVTLNTTAATQVIGQNPGRKVLQICNPNASIIVWIAPAGVTPAANGAGSYSLPAVSSGTIVCYTSPGASSPGGLGAAWSAITATTPATLTIYEYTN